eukprot:scaffold29120_cov89-Phaeocystis_antarctica.AAC.1
MSNVVVTATAAAERRELALLVQGGRQGDAELASLLRGQAWHRAHPRGLQAALAWKGLTLSEG